MAFVVEFGFRSYLQNILETKMNTFFASIVVGLLYSIFTANTTYGMEYAGYHFLYTFAFSMIIGELIRATQGCTIYIATVFHAAMTFALVFLFSEETGDIFSMKVIALSTTLVGAVFIIASLIIRAIVYQTTKQNLDEIEPNSYLSHTEDDDTYQDETATNSEDNNANLSETSESTDQNSETKEDMKSEADSDNQDTPKESKLEDPTSYIEDRHSSVVNDVKDEINKVEEQSSESDKTK